MRALITGITGQDGSYLAELLLAEGYDVHGVVRRVALEDPEHRLRRIRHIADRIRLHPAALESYASVQAVVEAVVPDECYHLAAESFVAYSLEEETTTITTNITATQYVLSAVREHAPACRVYFAASSELFGNATVSPQNEDTPFRPRSAYGISKLAGYHLTRSYRDNDGIFAVSGILYNHESPRRGFEFVTRKVTRTAAKIHLGLARELRLGNLDARRDWGYAGDYVRAMWLMLRQDEPRDLVVGTGVTHSVRDLVAVAFRRVGRDWRDHVRVDQRFVRPADTVELRADASRAREALGWSPSIGFEEIIGRMVDADLEDLAGAAPSSPIT